MSPKKLSAKEKIENALSVYMESGELSDITVAELIEKAGVGKCTFYRNYHDVYDVFEGMLGDFIERIIEAADVSIKASVALPEQAFLEYIKQIVANAGNFVGNEHFLIKYAIKNNDSFVAVSIVNVLYDKCKQYAVLHGMSEDEAYIYQRFTVSSLSMEVVRSYVDGIPNIFSSLYYAAELYQKAFARKESPNDNSRI